jgi:sialic acid synthase SpsE
MPIRIIAEGEINHNGEVALARRIIDSAKQIGADMVKFQCFRADGFIAPGSGFLQIFKDTELSRDEFMQVKAHADQVGIRMISTAGDLDGLADIVAMDLPVVKVGSTNITNVPLLEGIAASKLPVYLSTGASTLGEIEFAMDLLTRGGTPEITLFHCTVQYPADDENLNLRAIPTMLQAFPGVEIGYSDHSLGNIAGTMALALGATIFEKHFTVDNSLPGPDHGFSSDPDEMAGYIRDLRRAEAMLGHGRKTPMPVEARPRVSGRRYLTTMQAISAGTTLTPPMIRSRRIDVSRVGDPTLLMKPAQESQVAGWVTLRDLADGQPISVLDLAPAAP